MNLIKYVQDKHPNAKTGSYYKDKCIIYEYNKQYSYKYLYLLELDIIRIIINKYIILDYNLPFSIRKPSIIKSEELIVPISSLRGFHVEEVRGYFA